MYGLTLTIKNHFKLIYNEKEVSCRMVYTFRTFAKREIKIHIGELLDSFVHRL